MSGPKGTIGMTCLIKGVSMMITVHRVLVNYTEYGVVMYSKPRMFVFSVCTFFFFFFWLQGTFVALNSRFCSSEQKKVQPTMIAWVLLFQRSAVVLDEDRMPLICRR